MYVDVMMAAVEQGRKDEYLAHVREAAEIFKAHGALGLMETWEREVPDGELTSMPMAVKREPGEAVVVSVVRWPSREAAERGMAGVMSDPRMERMEMPFDGKRLIYGGFDVIMDA